MHAGIIIAIVIAALIICLGVAIFIFVLKKPSGTHKAHTTQHSYSLDQLISLAGKESNTKKIEELINIFVSTQTFVPKTNPISPDAKKKLSFIEALVLNKNINAKLVVKLSKDLKQKYPSYAKDIESTEQIAIAKRKMRE